MIRYRIAPQEAAELYARSAYFRSLLASGLYLYTQGHFCLNMPAFVSRGRLSRRARSLPQECCLGFSPVWRKLSGQQPFVACRRPVVKRMELVSQPEGFTAMLRGREEKTRELQKSLPPDFGGTVKALMECRGINRGDLAYCLGVDEKTLYRWLNGSIPARRTVFALGFALSAEPPLFDDLVRKAGYAYTISKEDNLIQMLRGLYPNPGLADCNRILQESGCAALTRSLVS